MVISKGGGMVKHDVGGRIGYKLMLQGRSCVLIPVQCSSYHAVVTAASLHLALFMRSPGGACHGGACHGGACYGGACHGGACHGGAYS